MVDSQLSAQPYNSGILLWKHPAAPPDTHFEFTNFFGGVIVKSLVTFPFVDLIMWLCQAWSVNLIALRLVCLRLLLKVQQKQTLVLFRIPTYLFVKKKNNPKIEPQASMKMNANTEKTKYTVHSEYTPFFISNLEGPVPPIIVTHFCIQVALLLIWPLIHFRSFLFNINIIIK